MKGVSDEWPDDFPVAQVRVARPTARLAEVVRFYRDALGLRQVGEFRGHAGYDGVMLGLPGATYHLEFTSHQDGSDCPAPSRDNLLVLYIPDAAAFERARRRLEERGRAPVEPENPYWAGRGLTYEDPDGWRVVLMNTAGISAPAEDS